MLEGSIMDDEVAIGVYLFDEDLFQLGAFLDAIALAQ
jgi:hypothetical protein